MKRTIWIMLVLVMGLLLGGCRIEDIGTSEPIEECLLYDYYNQRIVAYSLKKKKVYSENTLGNFFQYCFHTDCDLFTSGHSTQGFFKIVKKEQHAVKQLLTIQDKGSIFPSGCDVNRNLYFFTRGYDANDTIRRIVQFKDGKLMQYKNTGGNIIDGLLYKNQLYYTAYDEEKDYFSLHSIDIRDYDSKPKEYDCQLEDSILFEYDSKIYVASREKIYNMENEGDSYIKKNVNYFDKKNDKLIQIDINADTELELSIVDLKTRKEEYAVSNPVSFECKKGLITIYGDGFIEEYRTEDE